MDSARQAETVRLEKQAQISALQYLAVEEALLEKKFNDLFEKLRKDNPQLLICKEKILDQAIVHWEHEVKKRRLEQASLSTVANLSRENKLLKDMQERLRSQKNEEDQGALAASG